MTKAGGMPGWKQTSHKMCSGTCHLKMQHMCGHDWDVSGLSHSFALVWFMDVFVQRVRSQVRISKIVESPRFLSLENYMAGEENKGILSFYLEKLELVLFLIKLWNAFLLGLEF